MLSITLRACCTVMNCLSVHFPNTNENNIVIKVKIFIVNMNKDICVICEVEIENEDDCSTLTEKK